MKRKIFRKVSVMVLAIILLLQVASFAVAEKLTLKTLTDKNTYTVGDKVTVTIDWTEKMECAEFYIKFDSAKLKFEKATYADGTVLRDDYTNILGEGNLKFGWYGTESTKMLFVFEAKATGKAIFSIENPDGFATGDLEMPDSYDSTTYGSKEITINVKQNENTNTNTGNNTVTNQGGNTNTGNNTAPTPGGNTNTGNNTAPTPGGNTNAGNNTAPTPGGNTNAGNNTTTKPGGNTATGNNTTTKPGGNTATGNNTITKPNGNTNKVNKPSASNKVDNTTASGEIWQAGLDSTVVIAILLMALVGTIGFIKYRGLSDI